MIIVEETVVPGENHWPATSHSQTLSHIHTVVLSTPHHVLVSHESVLSYDYMKKWEKNPRNMVSWNIPVLVLYKVCAFFFIGAQRWSSQQGIALTYMLQPMGKWSNNIFSETINLTKPKLCMNI
jgi:hypothetical protein